MSCYSIRNISQTCSGITRGIMLNGELYAQRLQKLLYLHLFTDCFLKISLAFFSLVPVIEEKSS